MNRKQSHRDPQVRIGIVSDLHVGSIFGLMSPDFLTSAGAYAQPNTAQQYLWCCWLELKHWFADNRIDALVVNGDLIDGPQPAQRGTELCLPLLDDQKQAAAHCLRVLNPDGLPLYLTQGTEYHDNKAADAVEHIGESLGAIKYRGGGTGRFSKEVLDLDVGGVILNFAHHVGGASGFYRATGIDREAQWSALAGKEGKVPRADCLIRSHQHFFVHVEHASKHGAITPCWQLQTRFMRHNSVYRMLPDIGGLIVCVDPQAKAGGDDPISIKKKLFPLPE